MCKYCKLETLNKSIGEKSNNNPTITTMRDGSQIFEVSFDRYVVEEDGTKNNWLWLGLHVETGDTTICLKEKHAKIKYCPFCGEEL